MWDQYEQSEWPGLVEQATMTNQTLLKVGLIGTVVVGLCCFTPLLVLLLGAVGLSVLVVPLDYVLLPALAIFAAITAYALWKIMTPSSN